MTEENGLSWDQVNVEEEVTEVEQKSSENLSIKTPVGLFICTIEDCQPKERHLKNYTCHAANLKMRIDEIIEVEIDGKMIKIDDKNRTDVNLLYSGRYIFDEILLSHPSEKEALKKRRIFILTKTRVIAGSINMITNKMFAQDIIGKQVAVRTELNKYTDKNGNEKSNVKVAWDGYEYASNYQTIDDEIDC